MGRNVAETTVRMIIDQIKLKIGAALADIRADRNDPQVSTEAPQPNGYYMSTGYTILHAPAIFVIPVGVDFRQDRGANFIVPTVRVHVSAVVEDQDNKKLAIKAWRYQDALHEILEQTSLTSANTNVKIVIKVVRASFSPEFTESGKPGNLQEVFRKEVVLECDVEHFEKV